jgi:uncharacterized membrane protein
MSSYGARKIELGRPAWGVAALAGAGGGIATYLTVVKLVRSTPLFCIGGSACDIVQASRYATLLGVPTALWGAVLYLALMVLAVGPLTPRRWLWAFALAVSGTAFSGYLTVIAVGVLGAACLWCLASAVIMVAVLAALVRRRPPAGHRTQLQPARLVGLAGVVATVTVGLSIAVFNASAPGSPYAEALARHLTDSGAHFYGTFWCPACREQKRLFGHAASALPYVECDARGAGGRPDLCEAAGVRVYPTWTIRGTTYEGVTRLETLARLSGFTPAAPR